MKSVQIHEIEFEKANDSWETINYPFSGFFIVNDKENKIEDIRFINKENNSLLCIAPLDVLFRCCEIKNDEVKETKTSSEEILISKYKQKYDPDFILEFSRILLNRK